MRTRNLIVAAPIFAIALALSARAMSERPVVGLLTYGNPKDAILSALSAEESAEGGAPDGLAQPPMTLKATKGGSVEVLVMEGTFTPKSIEPTNRWHWSVQP